LISPFLMLSGLAGIKNGEINVEALLS